MAEEPENKPPEVPTAVGSDQEYSTEDADWEVFDAQEKAKKLQALFCNRAFVQPDGLHLRMSLGEWVGDETLYHTAVVIPHANALELGKLLVQMAEASINQQIDHLRTALASEESPSDGS